MAEARAIGSATFSAVPLPEMAGLSVAVCCVMAGQAGTEVNSAVVACAFGLAA